MSNSKIYLAGHPDDEDFWPIARALREREWDVRNYPMDLGRDLKSQLRLMLECNAVCFLHSWWTSSEANALQVIAGMTRMQFIHPETFEVLTHARG